MNDTGPVASPLLTLELSSEDVVKVQSATFLSLCAAFHGARLISMDNMAAILATHLQEGDASAGAQVISALVQVLRRTQPERGGPGPDVSSTARAFTVVEGGRGRDRQGAEE